MRGIVHLGFGWRHGHRSSVLCGHCGAALPALDPFWHLCPLGLSLGQTSVLENDHC